MINSGTGEGVSPRQKRLGSSLPGVRGLVGTERDFSGGGHIPFLDLGVGYMGMFTL